MTSPQVLQFAMLADRLTQAAKQGDALQALTTSEDIARLARGLGPADLETAAIARDLLMRSAALLDQVLSDQSTPAPRDRRHAVYASVSAA
jgi:hypothetical protein